MQVLPSCMALPDRPAVNGVDAYFAEEIDRVWAFLQTRPKHPELIMRMALLLEETVSEKQAEPWFEELKALDLPKSQLEEMNAKIRRQYRFSFVPMYESRENSAAQPDFEDGALAESSGEDQNAPVGPEAAALAAEAANDMERSATEYLRLYKRTGKAEYLALAAERFLWANQSQRALPLLIELSLLRPKDQSLMLKIADIYGWHGESKSKVIFLEKALNLRYRRAIHKKIVEELSAVGNVAEAINQAESYLARYPNDTDIKVILARLLFDQKQEKQALQILEKLKLKTLGSAQIEALVPAVYYAKEYTMVLAFCKVLSHRKIPISTRIDMQYYCAAARFELGDFKGSERLVTDAESALENQKFRVSAAAKIKLKLDFLLLKARIFKKLNRFEKLQDIHRRILELNPLQFESLVFWGETFRNQGQLERSQHYFEQALRIEPNNSYLIWSLAEIAYLRKNLPHARLLMEKLQQMPDFKDEAMLLALWKETGAWKKLADYISANSQRLLPEYRTFYLEALNHLGKNKVVAEMLYEDLAKNPFDVDAEKKLVKVADRLPGLLKEYPSKKAIWIEKYHQSLVDKISERIRAEPENKALLEERARIYGYMNRPDLALKDLNEILKMSEADLPLIERAAETAEWAGDLTQAMSLRRKIFQMLPENASNSIHLASLAFGKREFADAEKYLKASAAIEKIDPRTYFSAAMPVLMQSGRFADMRKLVKRTKRSVTESPSDENFTKSRVEYARILAREIGPVNRLEFSFMHDTDSVSLSNLQYYSRFNVKNHSFLEANLEDMAMNRGNSSQAGVRSRLLSISGNLVHADEKISCSFPMLVNNNDKVHLFVPALNYHSYGTAHEIAFEFSQTPVRDTPEALRQGLFSNNFNVTYRKKTGNTSWIQGNVGIRKNSAGYSGSFAGITFEKTLSYEPFRSIRYSFNTEDYQTENSDLFYLEDFIQSHTLAYAGQTDFYHTGRLFDSINWDIFTGLNNRNEAFHGASLKFERSVGRNYYVNAFANYYSSQNNRFEQAGGYKNWNYGISLEMRDW
jgi:tetratricopeptide (TPR) repeat protein